MRSASNEFGSTSPARPISGRVVGASWDGLWGDLSRSNWSSAATILTIGILLIGNLEFLLEILGAGGT